MDFFASPEEVVALERRLQADPQPAERLTLAWWLRQSATGRALELAQPSAAKAAPGRAALVQAEAAMQQGRLDEARRKIESTAHSPDLDTLLYVDTRILEAMLASASGQAPRALQLADVAADSARQRGLADRAQIASAFAAMASVYAAPGSFSERLEALDDANLSPVAAVYAGLARALDDFNRADHAAVARRLDALVEEARRLGMLQVQLRIQNTLAAAYSSLDDKETAIHWVSQSIEQARAAGWTLATGEALALLGNFYRETGQNARALETLEDARRTLAGAPTSRGYALACCYLAHAHLAMGGAARAVRHANEAEQAARAIQAYPIVVDVLTVAARAKARMGEPVDAAEMATQAIALAHQHHLPLSKIDALRALAEIHSHHPLPPPEGVKPEEAPLYYLKEARELLAKTGGHAETVAILRALSRAHERAGHPAEALAAERAALDHALSDESRRINNRLLAVEARHHVERRRHMAEVEAARTEALEATHAELRKARAELEVLANTDPLTGSANRRAFLEAAEAEVQRSLRYGRPLGLILCDIDDFQHIKHALGHPCAEQIVLAAARTLEAGRRGTDRLGRIGGEEFAMLLPETDLDTAFVVADRLRAAIHALRVPWEGQTLAFTMSFGVSVLGTTDRYATTSSTIADTLDGLVRRVDAALYQAKAGGRNRVAKR